MIERRSLRATGDPRRRGHLASSSLFDAKRDSQRWPLQTGFEFGEIALRNIERLRGLGSFSARLGPVGQVSG